MSRGSLIFCAITGVAGTFLIWALLRSADISWKAAVRLVETARPWPVVAVVVATALSVALAGEKWRLVEARLSGRPPSRRHAFALSAIGTALGQVLPTPVASALARGGGNRLSHGEGGRRGAFASVWEQLFDLGVISCLLAPAALSLALHELRIFVFGALAVAVAGDRLVGRLVPLVGRRLRLPSPLLAPDLCIALYRLALARFALLVLTAEAVAAAGGLPIQPLALAASIAPVAMASILSFLPAGLGVNEWSFTIILGGFAAPTVTVVSFALLNRVLVAAASVATGLIGALLVRQAKPAEAPVVAPES